MTESHLTNRMKESTSKEKVLKKVRDALVNATAIPFEGLDFEANVYADNLNVSPEEAFARSFLDASGKFIYCSNVGDLVEKLSSVIQSRSNGKIFCGESYLAALLKEIGTEYTMEFSELPDCAFSVSGCEVLIARHGSIVQSSRQGGGRKAVVVPPVQIVVATTRQLVNGLSDAFGYLQSKYGDDMPSLVTFVTGPSRTADIEKTLVLGAHGPEEIYLFLLEIGEQSP